jgi:hypothetical protein
MHGAIVRIAQPQIVGARFFVKHIISYSKAWGKKEAVRSQNFRAPPMGEFNKLNYTKNTQGQFYVEPTAVSAGHPL